MIAFIFILVSIVVPDPADSASAIQWAPIGDSTGQSPAIAGGAPPQVVRDDYGVTKKVSRVQHRPRRRANAGAPAAGTPDPGSAQAIAHEMVLARGWGDDQYGCLVALWNRESGWNVYAYNARAAPTASRRRFPAARWRTRRRRLADKPGHADRLGTGLHRRPLRHPVRRVGRFAVATGWY